MNDQIMLETLANKYKVEQSHETWKVILFNKLCLLEDENIMLKQACEEYKAHITFLESFKAKVKDAYANAKTSGMLKRKLATIMLSSR